MRRAAETARPLVMRASRLPTNRPKLYDDDHESEWNGHFPPHPLWQGAMLVGKRFTLILEDGHSTWEVIDYSSATDMATLRDVVAHNSSKQQIAAAQAEAKKHANVKLGLCVLAPARGLLLIFAPPRHFHACVRVSHRLSADNSRCLSLFCLLPHPP